MTDHKFEPFQQVLVRNRNFHPWEPMLYGYPKDREHVCAGVAYTKCIPYTPETAHLLGTSQPYEPPKPPVEYEWGQKVEVLATGTLWERGIWLKRAENPECPQQHLVAHEHGMSFWYKENEIRPMPDDTAAQ